MGIIICCQLLLTIIMQLCIWLSNNNRHYASGHAPMHNLIVPKCKINYPPNNPLTIPPNPTQLTHFITH